MRHVLLLCCLGACDPIWQVKNVATAGATAHTDAACIDAGLQASGFAVKRSGTVAKPVEGWIVGDIHVRWDPRQAGVIELEIGGVGTDAPTGALDSYRQRRDTMVAKLRETCGPFELGPESCQRVKCNGSQPSPAP